MIDETKVGDLAARVIARVSEATEDEWKAFSEELSALEPGSKIAVWSKVTAAFQGEGAPYTKAKLVHKHFSAQILEVFGVPVGDAGVGVQPIINGHRLLDRRDDRKPGAGVIDELYNSSPGPHSR